MRRAAVDHEVASHHVVRVVVEAAEAAAGHLETFEHVVVGAHLERVGPARDARPRAAGGHPAHDDRLSGRARPVEDDAAGIGRATVHEHEVARAQQRGHALQVRVGFARPDLIGGRGRGRRKRRMTTPALKGTRA